MGSSEAESLNGVRMSWKIWPPSSSSKGGVVVPVGCLYTPLKETSGLQLVEYAPVRCKGCGCVLNPSCTLNLREKTWSCPMCLQTTPLPAHYAEHISETVLPAESIASTIEYILPQVVCAPPVFLLVLDTAVIEEELDQAKDSLQQSLALMPQDALVGFVTFGAHCFVHELSAPGVPHSFAFRGSKDHSSHQVALQLGFIHGQPPNQPGSSSRRFLAPVADCEFALMGVLDDLARDSWPSAGSDRRPLRCTGAAISVALGLIEATCPRSSVRVTVVVGGPCNIGPGMVVGEELKETIRSHLDLQKERPNARYTKSAGKFYGAVAARAVACGLAIDIFACSLDQVGLYEMKVLADKTGGYMVMGDSFSIGVFKESFRKMLDCDSAGYLQSGFHAHIDVLTSPEVKCCGAIGGLASSGRKGASVSETEIGEAGTSQWVIGALDKKTTIAFYFDLVGTGLSGRKGFLQFQTAYCHPSGRQRLRVTTVAHKYANASMTDMVGGFDQEAAAVLTARYAVQSGWTPESVNRMLIQLVARFADYRKDDPGSFRLAPELAMFPQFMYHLRRSSFLQTFGTSPDETAYYRTVILRESTLNSLVMIQPALLQYSFEDDSPKPVLLDTCSLKPDVILLMDDFFHVVVWRGDKIQTWCNSGFQEREEYANFRALLQAPAADAKQILSDRFPVPKFVQTNAGGSQARFVTSKVNPSNGGADCGADATAVLTDDVSLKAFMENLIRMAVKS